MVLSVLPFKSLDILLHLFPNLLCNINKITSSSIDHCDLFIVGHKWLHHLSLHCFPILPGKKDEIKFHLTGPFSSTNLIKSLSSFKLHGPWLIWQLIFFFFEFFWISEVFFDLLFNCDNFELVLFVFLKKFLIYIMDIIIKYIILI